jgi:hypothetical protein
LKEEDINGCIIFKMHLGERGWDGIECIGSVQVRDQCPCELVNKPSSSIKCWKVLE